MESKTTPPLTLTPIRHTHPRALYPTLPVKLQQDSRVICLNTDYKLHVTVCDGERRIADHATLRECDRHSGQSKAWDISLGGKGKDST